MGWKPRLKFRAEPTILSQKRLKDMGSIISLLKMRLALKNVSKKWMVGKQKKRKLKVYWQKVCFSYYCCFCVVFYFVIVFILALFADLKRNNLFAQECRLVGLKIEREVGKDQTFQSLSELKAKINVSTRTLEVGTIISDEATGGPMRLSYRLKGDTKSVLSTSNLVEPLVYPLFFPYGERGWGAELSPGILWNK